MLAGLSDAEADELVRINEEKSLCLRAVNSLFPWDWKLADPDVDHGPYYQRADRIFSIMERLHIPYAVFGSGGARSLKADKPDSRETLYAFTKELARIAKTHGVTLLIEPLRHTESNIFNTVPETGDIIRSLGDPDVRLLCDVFHMAEEGTDLSCLPAYMDLTDHCHIAESPKRSIPGSEDSNDLNYNRIFARTLIRCGYDGAVSAECGFGDFRSDAVKALAYMRKIFAVADTVETEAVRDYAEEPVFILPKEGTVLPGISSARCGSSR